MTVTLVNVSWFKQCVLKSTSGNGMQLVVSGGLQVFSELYVSGCAQENLLLKFIVGSASAIVQVLSAPLDVFEAPNMPSITEVISLGPLGFRLNFTAPVIDRLHPLSGFIVTVGECSGSCSLSYDYSDGFDSNNAVCSTACNATNLQTLISLKDTYSFDQLWGGPSTAQTSMGTPWTMCDNDLIAPTCAYPAPNNSHFWVYFRNSGRRSIIGSMLCNQLYTDWASCSEATLLFQADKVYRFQITAYNRKYSTTYIYPGFARALLPYTGPLFVTMALPATSTVWQFYVTVQRPSTVVPRRGFLLDVSSRSDFSADVQSIFLFDRHNGSPNAFKKFVPSTALLIQEELASYAVSSEEGLSMALLIVASGNTPRVASQPQFRRGWDIPYINQNVTLLANTRYYARAYHVNNAGLGPGMGASVATRTTYSLEASSVSPSDLDPRGGTVVSIFGLGLGVSDLNDNIAVRIGSTSCNGVQVFGFTGSPLVCRAPAGPAGTSLNLVISIGNISAGGYTILVSSAFAHSGAVVTRLMPSLVAPKNVGTIVTVFGLYFGTNGGQFSAWVSAL
ncbi:MAG: IPT/TIG domain-containing protein, partial [Actinomycetes bacterium]